MRKVITTGDNEEHHQVLPGDLLDEDQLVDTEKQQIPEQEVGSRLTFGGRAILLQQFDTEAESPAQTVVVLYL